MPVALTLPVKVDTPVTLRRVLVALVVNPVGIFALVIVPTPLINKLTPLSSSYTKSPVTFKLPATVASPLKFIDVPLKL